MKTRTTRVADDRALSRPFHCGHCRYCSSRAVLVRQAAMATAAARAAPPARAAPQARPVAPARRALRTRRRGRRGAGLQERRARWGAEEWEHLPEQVVRPEAARRVRAACAADATGAAFAPITDYTARDGGFGPAVVTRNTGDATLGTDKVAIFRPAAAKYGQGGVTHPIIVWGNGHTNTVDIWQGFLSRVATYGFVVVAPEQTEVTAAPDERRDRLRRCAWPAIRRAETAARSTRPRSVRPAIRSAAAARSPSEATRASRPRSSSRRTATSGT